MIKGKIFSVVLIAVLAISSAAVLTLDTHAVMTFQTWILLNVSPNPVGVGQPIYMQCEFSTPTATASGNGGDHYTGIKITITDPNGKTTTMGPYTADAVGGVPSLEYTPTMIGTYQFQATYPGQVLTASGAYKGDSEGPSNSLIENITVQTQPISTIGSPPLPNAYWDFPIEATNYGWAQIGGSWLGLAAETFATTGDYDATGDFNPYSPAPQTAHIMWTKPTTEGGQPGGAIPGDEMHNYMTTSILVDCFEPIIIDGVLYYGDYNSLRTSQTSWNAIDLATGQTLWTRLPGINNPTSVTYPGESGVANSIAGQSTAETLKMGDVFSMHSIQEYGSNCLLFSVTGSTWRMYSAFDGTYLGNITGVIGSSLIVDDNSQDQSVGGILGYFVSQGNLTMWNMTQCFAGGVGGSAMGITLRIPTTATFNTGDEWNRTLPTTYNGNAISPAFSISRVTHDVILLTSTPTVYGFNLDNIGWALQAGYSATTGQQLWIRNITLPAYHYDEILQAANDVFVWLDKDSMQIYGYSMTNGSLLWGPTQLPFNALSELTVTSDCAYGNIYIWDIGGYVEAVNLVTGKLVWVDPPSSAGYNTPYGIYPIWGFGTDSIANGMIFLSKSRMYDPPMFENATRVALNCTNGQVVWSVLSFSGRACGAVADGYLVEWNSYDAQIYTFGRGPSQVTAAVQNGVTTQGNQVLISGMVTDISPGTKQAIEAANYPQGVPCVADSSMSAWMEHVYMQQPMPTNVTGVPVNLYVLDSNNNYRQIGMTTTDASGFYRLAWTPDISGTYTVYAAFAGTQSYYPSTTETSFTVASAAPTAPSAATPVAGLASTTTVEYGIVAIGIIIIVVGAVLAILVTRKRP